VTEDMITQAKPQAIYKALLNAVEDYCKRHYLTHELFAKQLNLKSDGDDLITLLNPETPQQIRHDQEQSILDKLDTQARKIYFETRIKEWDMGICKEPSSLTKVDISLDDLADDAMIESSESFTSVKIALEDGKLSKSEAKKIIKESKEAVRCHQNIIDCAEYKLEQMELG